MGLTTYLIRFTYAGGEIEIMHHDTTDRHTAWLWAVNTGLQQVKFYPFLVECITVERASA